MEGLLIGGQGSQATFAQVRTEGVVDPTWGAQRVVQKPDEYAFAGFQGGHYRVARSITGITAYAAGALIISFRWGLAGAEVLVKRVRFGFALTTAFTTAQAIDFDLIKSTNFTVSDTGGTAVAPITAASNRLRSKWMNGSQVTDLREPTAAGAALGAGTKTLDQSPLGIEPISLTANTLGVGGAADLWNQQMNAAHPFMLQVSEGFNIRTVTAMGAAGVIRIYYVIEWVEAPGL